MSDIDPVERAELEAELAFVASAVDGADYESQLVEGGADRLSELVVHLSTDEEGRDRILRMSFIPVGEEVEAVKFLQMYAPLPFKAPADRAADVKAAIGIVNEHVAIGRFGMHDDGELYFRYVLAGARHEMFDDEMLAEVVVFVDFHQENFGDYLEGVCEGELRVSSLAEVIRQSM